MIDVERLAVAAEGPSGAMVRADEIRWTLALAGPLQESIDVLGLDDTDTLACCEALQAEMRWLRSALHEALAQLAATTRQLDFARYEIHRMRTVDRRAQASQGHGA